MRKIVTILLAIFLIAGFTNTSKAQISIGGNAGIALPMGSWNSAVGMGFGASANGEYEFKENMFIGLNIGYYSFGEKNSSGVSASFIPIVADFKYFFQTEGFMPYAGAGLGMFMETAKASFLGVSTSASTSGFGFVPMVGFWMGDGFKYGASLKYNAVGDAFLGVNFGVIYPLK